MNGKYPVIAAVMMLATGCSQFSQSNHVARNYANPFLGTTVLTNSVELGYVAPWRTWNGLDGPAAP